MGSYLFRYSWAIGLDSFLVEVKVSLTVGKGDSGYLFRYSWAIGLDSFFGRGQGKFNGGKGR
jgi:hypothetical protein